jgi:hypothetical protein
LDRYRLLDEFFLTIFHRCEVAKIPVKAIELQFPDLSIQAKAHCADQNLIPDPWRPDPRQATPRQITA